MRKYQINPIETHSTKDVTSIPQKGQGHRRHRNTEKLSQVKVD